MITAWPEPGSASSNRSDQRSYLISEMRCACLQSSIAKGVGTVVRSPKILGRYGLRHALEFDCHKYALCPAAMLKWNESHIRGSTEARPLRMNKDRAEQYWRHSWNSLKTSANCGLATPILRLEKALGQNGDS
jgi:hypothetical protein